MIEIEYTFADGQKVWAKSPFHAFITYNQAKMSGLSTFGFADSEPVVETTCKDSEGKTFSISMKVTDEMGYQIY